MKEKEKDERVITTHYPRTNSKLSCHPHLLLLSHLRNLQYQQSHCSSLAFFANFTIDSIDSGEATVNQTIKREKLCRSWYRLKDFQRYKMRFKRILLRRTRNLLDDNMKV